MVDLDYFKHVNDVYGHPAGDAVLSEAARRMQTLIRPYDGIGRYGGEEFLAILVGCGLAEATEVAERLRTSLEQQKIEISGGTITVTGSFGVIVYESHGTGVESSHAEDNINTLLKAADDALYQAKHQGRNQVITGKIIKAQAA